MVLHSEGLWHKVLMGKYLKNLSVVAWLKGNNFNFRGVSIIWKGFLQTLPWLGRFLSWLVGNGQDVLLGTDPIIGTQAPHTLPLELKEYLEDLDITTLAQAHNIHPGSLHYWFTVEDLYIAGDWKLAWDTYTWGLEMGRIRLHA